MATKQELIDELNLLMITGAELTAEEFRPYLLKLINSIPFEAGGGSSFQVKTTPIASPWPLTTENFNETDFIPAAGSNFTAVEITFADLKDGGKIQAFYKKTTASNCTLTFTPPSGKTVRLSIDGIILENNNCILNSTNSGEFLIQIQRMDSTYLIFVYTIKL